MIIVDIVKENPTNVIVESGSEKVIIYCSTPQKAQKIKDCIEKNGIDFVTFNTR